MVSYHPPKNADKFLLLVKLFLQQRHCDAHLRHEVQL